LDLAIGLLLLAFLLSMVANSPSMDRTAFGEALRTTLVFAVDYFAFFYAAVSVMGSARRHLDVVLRVAVLTVVFTAVLGLIEQATGKNVFTFLNPILPVNLDAYIRSLAEAAVLVRGTIVRVRSTFEGPHALGTVLTLATPLLIHYSSTAKRWRSLYAAGAVLCGFAALFTASRGVYVAFVIAIFAYFVGAGRLAVTRLRALAVVVVLAAILASSSGLRQTMSVYFRGLIERKERSIHGRLVDYTNVLRQFDKTPVAGSGPGTWAPRALRRGGKVDPNDPAAVAIDNYYLNILGELGAAGFLAFVAVLLGGLAVAIRGLRRARAPTERSLLAALVAANVSWLFLTFVFDIFAFGGPVRLYLILLAATMVASGSTRARARPLAVTAHTERA